NGDLDIASGARALDAVFGTAQAGNPVRQAVMGSLPAQLALTLDSPGRDGVQSMSLAGKAGAAEISVGLEMTGGIAGLGRENLGISIEAAADSGAAMLEQVGLAPLIPGTDGAIASVR